MDPVVQSIMEVVRQVHCDAEKHDAIELALTEALANAVVHGAKADPPRSLNVMSSATRTRAY